MNGQMQLPLRRAQPQALSVSQLVRRVRETLETNLDEYWVTGEISNARIAPSNHFYFTLKDPGSTINVVMFRSAFRRMRFRANDGMEVIVRGRVSLYEQRGSLQFYAEEIEPRGVGALQVAFEQLKRQLAAEGLFDPSRKKPLPFMPRTIGIVTALRSAAVRDIVTIILARFPKVRIIVRPALTQGTGAASDVAEALDDLNRHGESEVIIVGRGGGSLEDLWAFNEEAVARAIDRSRIPIISAVGHEIDYTIADFVADARAATPTAAAQMVVPELAELKQRVEDTTLGLAGAMRALLNRNRKDVKSLSVHLRDPRSMIRQARQRLDECAESLASRMRLAGAGQRRELAALVARLRAPSGSIGAARLTLARAARELIEMIARLVESKRVEMAQAAGRLDSLSPLRVLERGYAVVTNPRDGRAVISATGVEVGDDVAVRLHRGRLRTRIVAREI
jgi:exodeoxyribonuclease VII large subunit